MKTKDYISFILLAIVLITVGSLIIGKLGGNKGPRTAEIEIVAPIDPNFDERAQSILLGLDPDREAEVFSIPVNLEQGFGNNNPFRPE